MQYYYHYTAKRNLERISKNGVFKSDSNFTTDDYFHPRAASQALGIPLESAEVVLKFSDDGFFVSGGSVNISNRYIGGGSQYEHRGGKAKPMAIRNILSRTWEKL